MYVINHLSNSSRHCGRHAGSKKKPEVSSYHDMLAELEVLEKNVKLVILTPSSYIVSAISV